MKVKGLEVTIEFDGAKKFKTKDAQSPLAFELAGSDKIFKPAIAVIQGTKIILQSEQVVKPIAIRFAWGADPKVNLVNELDLPVRPFRTDEWPVRGSSLFAQPLESKAKLDEKYSPQSIVKEEIPGWKWCGQGIDTEIFGKENVVQFFGHDDIQLLVMGQRKAKWKQLPSPALAWEKKIENTKNGLTFEIEAQMYRANIPYKGISLQVTLADDKITKTYRIDFAPMHIYAYREDYTDVIAYNIDNGTRYHKYRIAIRPDGVAQVYFDNELAGMAVAGVVTDTAESGSYIRFGKLETQGDITVNIGSVSFDKTGAYAP
jgi:hypothetical protein